METNNISVDNLIALCHIVDDYEEFNKKLISFINDNKYNKYNIITKLDKISKNEPSFYSKKAKQFYNNNKKVIDIINKYTNIYDFINYNYTKLDTIHNKLNYYYNYLSQNKAKLSQIINLLETIKKLGFKEIDLNEEYDFTEKEYHLSYVELTYGKIMKWSTKINYLENIYILPNYDKNSINYRTNNSNYHMITRYFDFDHSLVPDIIIVNNLLFNPNKLPKNISKEEIIDKITSLKNNNEANDNLIRNYVDLSIAIDDLENQYLTTHKIINELNAVESKQELIQILSEIKNSLEKLRALEISYNSSIINGNNKVTKEELIKEKKLYLDKREFSSIDLC